MSIETPEGLIKPEVELVGIDSNAYSIMGTVARALKNEGNDQDVIDAYMEESKSGDYDHLLVTALAYTEMPD